MSDANVLELWTRAKEHLSKALNKDVFSRWIAVIEPLSLENGVLTLAVDNDFYQTWLEDNYLPLIRAAVTAETGREIAISFTIRSAHTLPEPHAAPIAAEPVRRSRSTAARSSAPALNPKYVFDEFIVGPSNNFVHAAALAVAQAPAKAYNPLFIYGGNGLGKTHVMQAIGHHVLATSRKSVSYISSETLMNEYIEALGNRTLPQFRRNYRTTDILLIDDIHFLAGKDRLQEEFFHTFNALFDARKQIVMTSDRPACEISGLEQRLVSRFEWGIVTELESPDFETRVAILRHKLKQVQTHVSDELLLFIARNVRLNIRRLEGALIRAVSYMSLTGRELTLESLKYLLRDALENEQQSDVTFDDIQKTVADHYDIRMADMTSKHRPRSIAVPRQVAMYLCRRMTSSSLPEIASAFRKTHATVLHACRSINSRMDVDTDLKDNVERIAKKLSSRPNV